MVFMLMGSFVNNFIVFSFQQLVFKFSRSFRYSKPILVNTKTVLN